MKKNNYIFKVNQQFNQKKLLLVFLILFLGTTIPAISGSSFFNFWYRLYNILTDDFFNMALYLAISLNFIYYLKDAFKNYFIINRYPRYIEIINQFLKDIIIFDIYLVVIALILAIGGAFSFCDGNFSFITHQTYNINLLLYIIFFAIRNFIISILSSTILYFCYIIFNKLLTTIFIVINCLLFMLLPSNWIINHFYNMHVLPQYYYKQVIYSSFTLEIIISFIEILLLILLIKVLYQVIENKKRDILCYYN